MLLKKLFIKILTVSRLRNILYFARKKLKRSLYLAKNLDDDLSRLMRDGFFTFNSLVEPKIIDQWMERYKINGENITPSEGNLIIPFFNAEIHDLLTNSQFSELLDKYFDSMYGCKPVLQCLPSLVMTYPSISQDEFKSGAHNFPAVWHVDYLSEFTIHMPLLAINSSNTHTMYAVNTHTSFLNPPLKGPEGKKIARSFAKKSDVVMIDVDGWHTGRLEGTSPRIMVQFKFTKGNDLLGIPTDGLSDKLLKQIDRTKRCIQNYDELIDSLIEDQSYIKAKDFSDTPLAIIGDSVKMYEHYISEST